MKKIKKYIYPFLFSALFWILYFATSFISNTFSTDGGLTLTVFFLFLIIWCYVIVPIFSVRYIRLVRNENLKFLFSVYNPIVLTAVHVLPWIITNSLEWYFALILTVFLIWSTLWSILPLVIYLISLKKKAEAEGNTAEVDAPPAKSTLTTNKKAKIVALCFILFYTLTLVFSADFAGLLLLQIISPILPFTVFSSALILIFAMSYNKSYWLKEHLLPIAFGVSLVASVLSLVLSMLAGPRILILPPAFVYTTKLLSLAFTICMFVGSLRDFKYVVLLKYGALGAALLELINRVAVIFVFGLNARSLIDLSASVLFYIGIFIIATCQKSRESEPDNECKE